MKDEECLEAQILKTWRNFISNGKPELSQMRQSIVDSWMRCYQQGVNPLKETPHRMLDPVDIAGMLQCNQELIEIAQPFMRKLYQFVEGSGFVVVLTDRRGFVMEVLGDDDILRNPRTNNFFLGANWSELEAGSNAIGTALFLQQPIQISGAEHYCRQHHGLTCSAAPIFASSGEMIGILDVSGASHASHLHTLGMVVAAAEAIHALIHIQSKNRELRLTNHRLTNLFNAMSDGVIMIDAAGMVNEMNPVAKTILGKSMHEILGVEIEKVICSKKNYSRKMLQNKEAYNDEEWMVDSKQGLIHCSVSGEPIMDERGVVTGGIIILRPIKKVHNLVNRFSGHYTTLRFTDIIGESSEIAEAIRIATLAAATSANVLLQGESGTGKDVFAQAIHSHSNRQGGPFLAVNCGAIPRELIGSELFGYEEGAFTGAKRGGKPGKFEMATGGTLFLDEIGDMPMEQQVALLRVLQDKKVIRIGSDKVIPVDVRVICATNKNLWHEVEKGVFRQDLYYRLNVISIFIPPLRERADDIDILFRHFLTQMDRDKERQFHIKPEVMDCMKRYRWPGNVRELQNIVERIVSLAEGQIITLAHLPPEIYCARPTTLVTSTSGFITMPEGRRQRKQLLEEAERQDILSRLAEHGGNVSMAARDLGLSRNTLYRKMRLYAIEN